MVFKKLKENSLRKHLERQIEQRDASNRNAKVRTIGFLVDEMNFTDFEYMYDIFKELKLQPKDVKVFTFIESKKKLPSLRQNQVQSKDFDWKGNLHNQNALEFLEKPLDVLVGVYENKHKFLDLMVATSKAAFKVGFKDADARLYDLLLGISPKEKSQFTQELSKYLHIMGKI